MMNRELYPVLHYEGLTANMLTECIRSVGALGGNYLRFTLTRLGLEEVEWDEGCV